MLIQRNRLKTAVNLERHRLDLPIEIVRAGPNTLIGMFRAVMVGPSGSDFTVFHIDLPVLDTIPITRRARALVNCNSWFESKFEEPFDKLRVNG